MQLKKIIKEMANMPNTLGGFNDTPKLTAEQKNKLMEMVGRYNELGQKLRMENALIETASALSEISQLAETYACNEASDWFATEVVKTDFKRARNISETFQKMARECHGKVQQLNALYEDMGHILGRYYEISDPMSEVSPNPADIKGQRGLPNQQPQTVMQEVKPNTSNISSQRQLPANGAIKEVNCNDKNIKSQRNLPSGGPAPAQVKEVSCNDKNIKSQRELPHTGGPATPQIKEARKEDPDYEDYLKWKKNKGNKSAGMSTSDLDPKDKIKFNVKPTVKEVAVDSMNANIKSQRDLPSGGPTSYNPPKDPKDTGSIREEKEKDGKENEKEDKDKNPFSLKNFFKKKNTDGEKNIKEVNYNEDNLQSQRELPQGGPESYTPPKLENPSIPVSPAGAGECNVKGERDVPQGGPAKDTVYKGQNESMSLREILKTIKR